MSYSGSLHLGKDICISLDNYEIMCWQKEMILMKGLPESHSGKMYDLKQTMTS